MMSVLSNATRARMRSPSGGTAANSSSGSAAASGAMAAQRIARLAREALIAEAELTPKPGLVDRRGNGAHTDLSLDIMRRSAVAIEPYFQRMAIASIGAQPSQSLREELAFIGRHAERAMLEATGGSNAHKGAIWALGLLVSAAAIHNRGDAKACAAPATSAAAAAAAVASERAIESATALATTAAIATSITVATTAKEIASFEDHAIPRLVSHGDAVARRYGVAGARGEALSGFPHVIGVALPTLRRKRRDGATEEVARLDALLSIISRLDDTCLLYRGGEPALAAAKHGAAAVEAVGGIGTARGRQLLWTLDRRLLQLNVSPGGSADLLAAALFLDAIERGRDAVQADESATEVPHGAY